MSEEINPAENTLEAVATEIEETIAEETIEQEDIDNTSIDNTSIDNTGAEEVETPRPTVQQENLKALRESRNKLQAERDQYSARIKQLEQANAKTADSLDDDLDYEDDSTKEIKVIKKHLAEMSVNNSRMKLQTQYPDFNKIVNQDSISILKERFPEIAATLDQSTDIYNTGVSAYNIIKKFELHRFEDFEDQKRKVETNINKPRPANTIKATSALVHASDYSDLKSKDTRDEILRMAMERAAG